MSNDEKKEEPTEEPTGEPTGETPDESTGQPTGEPTGDASSESTGGGSADATGEPAGESVEGSPAASTDDSTVEKTGEPTDDSTVEKTNGSTDKTPDESSDESKSETTSEPAADSSSDTTDSSTETAVEKASENPKRDRERRMTFLEHLLELRTRLVSALVGIIVMMVLTLVFYKPVFAFLWAPIDRVNHTWRTDEDLQKMVKEAGFSPNQNIIEPINTNPLGLMYVLMKVAIYAGLMLASPWLIYQIWAFVAPGLTESEARAIRPVLLGGIFFFVGGASFCYFIVFPLTLHFLVWFDVHLHIKPSYIPTDYFKLLLSFMFVFGLVFEIPLISAVFARLGLLKPEWLTKFWRYVIVGCFLVGALLSPGGDPVSMIIMSSSLLVLYLLSIVLAKFFYTRRQKVAADGTSATQA